MEKIIYSKSLKAKLTLERNFMMESYQELMDVINTRKDILVISSFPKDRIAFGKNKVALIKAFRKNIVVYYALNPNKINEKYSVSDVSDVKAYINYPTKLIIDTKKDLKNAIKLMEKALDQAGAKEITIAEDIDYNELYPVRTFDELVELGLIKKRIKYIDDSIEDYASNERIEAIDYKKIDALNAPKKLDQITAPEKVESLPKPENKASNIVNVPMVNVRFKVMVKGKKTDDLYLFTNYTNWDEDKVLKLNKKDDYFVLDTKFPKDFDLEFKISLSNNWHGVEKGIFGEEIKNHKYYLTQDLEIEDIIYNFRLD